jgi:transcriptional regulator with XRE-family HTH domain
MRGGLIIKEGRLRAGLSQRQLADRLGTKQSVVARWETGAAAPSFDTVLRAVRACGLDLLVSLVPYDGSDYSLLDLQLAMSPEQRVEQLTSMLEFERLAHSLKPVE